MPPYRSVCQTKILNGLSGRRIHFASTADKKAYNQLSSVYGMMGEIRVLRTVSFEIVLERTPVVTPHVDRISLASLVEAYERANNYADGRCYGGLRPEWYKYGPLNDYFTGNVSSDHWSKKSGIYLLGCQCGEVGCWPLIASVRRAGDTFQWEQFRQPFRLQRDYSGFGPFIFDRTQYEDAVSDLVLRLESAKDGSAT
jgi:hypothetical protein